MTEEREKKRKKSANGAEKGPKHASGAPEQVAPQDLKTGELLRRARLERGLELEEVSAAIHVRAAQLRALEEGHIDSLPGMTYALGFVKSYAQFLKLDAATVTHKFKTEHNMAPAKPALKFPEPIAERKMPDPVMLGVAAVAVAICLVAWTMFSGGEEKTAAVTSQIPSPPADIGALTQPNATPAPGAAPAATDVTAAVNGAPASAAGVAAGTTPDAAVTTSAAVQTSAAALANTAGGATSAAPLTAPADTTAPAPATPAVTLAATPPAAAQAPVPPAPAAAKPPMVSWDTVSAPHPRQRPTTGQQQAAAQQAAQAKAAADKAAAEEKADAQEDEEDAREDTENAKVAQQTAAAQAAKQNVINVHRGKSRVMLQAKQDSWVQITDANHHVVFRQVLHPGDKYYVPDAPGMSLITSNAGGFDVFVDGGEVQPVGRSGDIVRGVALDPDRLSVQRVRVRGQD